MKRIISRVYRVLFKFTGNKSLSFALALVYVSALNLTIIYGLSFLLKDLLPTRLVLQLFAYPYFFLTCFAMLATNYVLAPAAPSSKKAKAEDYKPVAIYTAVSLLLLAYACFGEHIF